MKKDKGSIFLYASIGSYFVMSGSFLIMPFADFSNDKTFIRFLPGILFWLFLFLGIVTTILFGNWRKKIQKKQGSKEEKFKYTIGVMSVFKSRIGAVFDILTVFMLLVFIMCMLITNASGYICYAAVSLFVFCFCMHCIFNGKNYLYFIKREKEK